MHNKKHYKKTIVAALVMGLGTVSVAHADFLDERSYNPNAPLAEPMPIIPMSSTTFRPLDAPAPMPMTHSGMQSLSPSANSQPAYNPVLVPMPQFASSPDGAAIQSVTPTQPLAAATVLQPGAPAVAQQPAPVQPVANKASGPQQSVQMQAPATAPVYSSRSTPATSSGIAPQSAPPDVHSIIQDALSVLDEKNTGAPIPAMVAPAPASQLPAPAAAQPMAVAPQAQAPARSVAQEPVEEPEIIRLPTVRIQPRKPAPTPSAAPIEAVAAQSAPASPAAPTTPEVQPSKEQPKGTSVVAAQESLKAPPVAKPKMQTLTAIGVDGKPFTVQVPAEMAARMNLVPQNSAQQQGASKDTGAAAKTPETKTAPVAQQKPESTANAAPAVASAPVVEPKTAPVQTPATPAANSVQPVSAATTPAAASSASKLQTLTAIGVDGKPFTVQVPAEMAARMNLAPQNSAQQGTSKDTGAATKAQEAKTAPQKPESTANTSPAVASSPVIEQKAAPAPVKTPVTPPASKLQTLTAIGVDGKPFTVQVPAEMAARMNLSQQSAVPASVTPAATQNAPQKAPAVNAPVVVPAPVASQPAPAQTAAPQQQPIPVAVPAAVAKALAKKPNAPMTVAATDLPDAPSLSPLRIPVDLSAPRPSALQQALQLMSPNLRMRN